MRTIPMPESGEPEADGVKVGYADWKDTAGTVLDAIDGLLEAHGLEIVQYDTQSDEYIFKVEKMAVRTDVEDIKP